MKKLSLNRDQLKIIAIISMVIDHIAWGFVDFYSPLGQVMHVLGRFTIPIMCFFIAEGFRKTSNLKKYILRLFLFGVLTLVPFYIFFHEEYGMWRQNVFFDLLYGLLMLTTLESKKLEKWMKVVIVAVLFSLSAVFGGWPITPSLFILTFYYGRDFKEKCKWFIISDVTTVVFLTLLTIIDNAYGLMSLGWVVGDRAYFLGFMLALPLLACYNGEKGRDFGGRYFFYLFYPCHFMVLAILKLVILGVGFFD